MQFIIKPRGYGKTWDACREAYRTGYPILTANKSNLIYQERCRQLGIPMVQVRSVQDLVDGKFFSSYVIIDDVDSVLKELLKVYGIIPTLCTMSI